MRKLMALIVVLIIVLVAVGIYRDWFGFSTQRDGSDENHIKLSVDVDKQKIKDDAKAAEDKAAEIGKSVKEKLSK